MRVVRWAVAVIVLITGAFFFKKVFVSFIQFGARSKEAEPRTNLRELARRQRAFFADAGRWATSFEELDFVRWPPTTRSPAPESMEEPT